MSPTGRKISWPEQSMAIKQLAEGIGATLGTPLVVMVVANVVVEVAEMFRVAESTATSEVVKVTVLSALVVVVDPSAIKVALAVVSVVKVRVFCTCMFVVVGITMVVTRVLVGTVTVTKVVPEEMEVALLNGAVVNNGRKVEAVTLGMLVTNGWTGGFPAVSSVV